MRPRSWLATALSILSVTVLLAGWPAKADAIPALWVGNGHYYDFIITNSGNIDTSLTWQSAVTAASSSSFMGVAGYLATITSSGENNFINTAFNTGNSSKFAWIGGHEPSDDGVWKWATGPEAGTQFSNFATPTAPFNYANWGGVEPSDTQVGEDFAMFNIGLSISGIAPGQWADAVSTPSSADPVIGYLVEYPTPEPATLLLLGTGLFGLGLTRRRRKI